MKKNNSLCLGIQIGILVIAGSVCIAQPPTSETELSKVAAQGSEKTRCSQEKLVMPPSFDMDRRGFTDYVAIMSNPEFKRAAEFSKLAPEAAALVMRLHLSVQIVRRNLSSDQRLHILRTIASATSDMYRGNAPSDAKTRSMDLQRKASRLFSRQEIYEIFSSISGKFEDVSFIRRYEELIETPIANRKLRFIDSPPHERRNMLLAQAAYFLATSEISDEQGLVYFRVIDAMTPNAFEGSFKETILVNHDAARLFELKTAVETAFSKSEKFLYFSSLGAHKVDVDAEASAAVSSNSVAGPCLCNYMCSLCYECVYPSGGCSATKVGCGFLLLDPCDSRCQFNWSYCY
ncbi:MAG: bacteriocin fulvocin C-related protein [Pyrinomonadaceae bacterium]|nr:bacteriocin fulvocin C-related protein [Pyrinomonadaceae bacterium]